MGPNCDGQISADQKILHELRSAAASLQMHLTCMAVMLQAQHTRGPSTDAEQRARRVGSACAAAGSAAGRAHWHHPGRRHPRHGKCGPVDPRSCGQLTSRVCRDKVPSALSTCQVPCPASWCKPMSQKALHCCTSGCNAGILSCSALQQLPQLLTAARHATFQRVLSPLLLPCLALVTQHMMQEDSADGPQVRPIFYMHVLHAAHQQRPAARIMYIVQTYSTTCLVGSGTRCWRPAKFSCFLPCCNPGTTERTLQLPQPCMCPALPAQLAPVTMASRFHPLHFQSNACQVFTGAGGTRPSMGAAGWGAPGAGGASTGRGPRCQVQPAAGAPAAALGRGAGTGAAGMMCNWPIAWFARDFCATGSLKHIAASASAASPTLSQPWEGWDGVTLADAAARNATGRHCSVHCRQPLACMPHLSISALC